MGLYENHGLAMLDNLVFLSNSIPKSGSSLLFNLQRDFLLSLSGQEACDYSPLEQAGIQVQGSGFLPTKVLPDFIKLMNSGEIKQKGPLILKIHAPISKQLRAWYEANSCCFISTIVRDPLDILISAM